MRSSAPPPVPQRGSRPWWLLAALPLLPALAVGFLLDDWIGLARLSESGWAAVAFQAWPSSGEFLRPLGWAVFQLELAAFGVHGVAFHAVHLGLFIAGAWLTGRLAARLGGDRRSSTAAAALALLYPGRTESYAWLAAGFDLLALDLGLALLLLHLRWRAHPTVGRAASLAVLAFVAPLAKESAFAVLPLLALWELLPGLLAPAPRRGRLAMLGAAAAGFGLGGVYRLCALGGIGGYAGTTLARALSQVATLPGTVLRAGFVPVNPYFGEVSTSIRVACALALAAASLAALLRARRTPEARRLLAAGATLAAVALLPEIVYLPATTPWTAGRFLTFFGAGLAVAASAAVARAGDPRRGGRVVVAALAAAWTVATVLNLLPWLEAARGRDALLDAIGEDTRAPGPHEVWIDGPVNRLKGAHLLGGGLQAAVEVTFSDREIEADSAFFQHFQHRPVRPPRPRPGVRVHLYRFDPSTGRVRRLPPRTGPAGAGKR